MNKFKLTAILLCCITALSSSAQTTISHATISFKIKNLGINTNGTIGGLHADAKFTPGDLPGAKIDASVEVTTLNTDNSTRDEHLKSEDYFDLAHYPKISLKSISFKHKSGNNYYGQFNLTIKDKTKIVEIPFSYIEKGNAAVFNGTFKINRLDFGVGGKSMILSDEVTITIEAEEGK